MAVDAFRGDLPFARTDWERPNYTTTASWTSTLTSNLINELTYTYSNDDVFINVFQEGDLYKRSQQGDQLPVHLPGEGDLRQDSDGLASAAADSARWTAVRTRRPRPVRFTPSRTRRPGSRAVTRSRRASQVEYSGEDDFDQINVSAIPGSTNNQNGRFEFLDNRARRHRRRPIANAALGLFSNYAELGQRNFTKWRSLATDVFVQDSWRPTSQLTIEGGVRWVLWPPWYSTTNNIANFDPRFYDPAQAAIINPATGRLIDQAGATTASSCRATASKATAARG